MIRTLVIGVLLMFAMVMTGATGVHAGSVWEEIAALRALKAAVATLQATVTALQTALAAEIAARQAADAALQASIGAALQVSIGSNFVSRPGPLLLPGPLGRFNLMDLASENGQGDRRIVTTVTSRIFALATVVASNTSAAAQGAVSIDCKPTLVDGSNPIDMGQSSTMTLPLGGLDTLAITGALVMGAGTYNVLANCAASPTAGVFERGNLIVWAVPVEE